MKPSIAVSKINSVLDKITLQKNLDLAILKKVRLFVVKSGGKRLRPLFHVYMAKLQGYKGELCVDIGAIGELIHAASLLHDDVVDEAKFRRTQPTLNVIYDNKTSILAGDYLLASALQHLSTLNIGIILLPLFTRVIHFLAIGELRQKQEEGNLNLQFKTYEKIILGKTASLFGCMSESSYMLVHNSNQSSIQKKYREFGEGLGRIFQLRDDYLDYFHIGKGLGKESCMDFKKGLVTWPLIALLKKIPQKEKKQIKQFFESSQERESKESIQHIMYLYEAYKVRVTLKDYLNLEIKKLRLFILKHPKSIYQDFLINELDTLFIE